MRNISAAVICVFMIFIGVTAVFADEITTDEPVPMLRAAIFVQNHAGPEFRGQIDPLTNQLAARLNEKGFSVIDRRDVLTKFSESRESDATTIKAAKTLEQLSKYDKSDSRLEDALTGGSALRIARQIGADYLIMATINSLSQETRTFKGQGTVYGTNNETTIFNLKLAVKVLEGGQGGAVYGDVVTTSERIAVGENLVIATNDIYPRLIEAAAAKIADNISNKIELIRSVKVNIPAAVKFTVTSNIKGSTVELDGAVLGSTPGIFSAEPGIHTLRVSKEWLTNWERTVNITPNQTINVALELSDEGIQRYTTLERFKAEISIAKEQSDADAYAKKRVAEGEKQKRERSYERYQGAPTTNIIH
ncbi:MAG: PEGA domain-containing protein [Desulfuromonadales bacterium]|nr:PEGA domain-containing protein [Desulfuromonadales bacterium]